MPLDDEISALSKSDLRERLNECREARAAQRLAQREAMTAGAAATDNDVSSYAAKIHESETAIQEFDEEMASLGMAMRQRASPAKTRPPASNLRPTIKSKTADQTEPCRNVEAEAAARGAAAGGCAKRQRGGGGGGGSGDAMRDQRAAELLRPSASMEGLLQSLGVRQAFAGFGGYGSGGGGNPNESHAQQHRGDLPPSSSPMQLLYSCCRRLEAQVNGDGAAKLSAAAAAGAEGSSSGVGGGGSAQDLVNSPSIQSLLGLLRSSSAASLGQLGTDADSRAASMLQLSSLAGQLATAPSAADFLGSKWTRSSTSPQIKSLRSTPPPPGGSVGLCEKSKVDTYIALKFHARYCSPNRL